MNQRGFLRQEKGDLVSAARQKAAVLNGACPNMNARQLIIIRETLPLAEGNFRCQPYLTHDIFHPAKRPRMAHTKREVASARSARQQNTIILKQTKPACDIRN
jgi:hypothetical protein